MTPYKKQRFLGVLCGLLAMGAVTAAGEEDGGSLRVTVDSVGGSTAPLRVCLFTSPEGFPAEANRAFRCFFCVPENSSAAMVFKGVPWGPVAISVYQDLNRNGILDTGFLGIPKEPVGVGPGDTTKTYGKPRFKNAQFNFEKSDTAVNIKLKDPRKQEP